MTAAGFWQKVGRVIDETVADLRSRIAEVFDGPAIPHESDDLRMGYEDRARAHVRRFTEPDPQKAAGDPHAIRCADCGGLLIPGGSGRYGPVCGDCGRPADARDRA